MTPERRKQVLLGLLLVALVAFAVTRLGPLLGGDDGAGPRIGGVRGGGGATGPEVADLASLEPMLLDYRIERNPFDFGGPSDEEMARQAELERQRREAEEARRRAEEEARRRAEEEARRRENAPPPPPPPPPTPPSLDLSYLGSFGPERRRIGVLTDGETIYNVRVGDVVEEKFVVTDIGFESIAVKHLDFPDFPAQRLGTSG